MNFQKFERFFGSPGIHLLTHPIYHRFSHHKVSSVWCRDNENSDCNLTLENIGTARPFLRLRFKPGFPMIVTVIVSIRRRLIGDTSPMCRSRSPTVTIIWKAGLTILSSSLELNPLLTLEINCGRIYRKK